MDDELKYMVCTRCYTYNHAPYIEDTLRGFCMQETTFPVVYCIVDDASTDGEREVLKKWAETHLNLSESNGSERHTDYGEYIVANQKGRMNQLFVILLLSENHKQVGRSKLQYILGWIDNSKYNALCEGDDYWIDPKKLSKQVKILESDESVGLCYAQAKVYDDNSKTFTTEIKGHSFDTFEQQMLWNYIPTLTVCMRTNLRKRYESEKKNWVEAKTWKMGDFPMWLWFCLNGKVVFLDDIVAVYRVTSGTASRPQTLEGQLAFVESTYSIKMHFAQMAQVDSKITNKIELDRNKGLAYTYINNGEYRKGRSYSKQLPLFVRTRVFLYMVKRMIIKNNNN